MAQPSPTYRYRSWPHATPVKRRKKPFRRLRRFLLAIILVAMASGAAAGYLLHVYAPGLRAEARTVPALVRAQLASHNAGYVPLAQISPSLQEAIVAIEDRRFYQHPGIDPIGLLRALWVDLTAQHRDQGGSTLEEQLVKRAIVGQDTNLHDKLRTMALAWAVDQEFTKSQILELYLNAAYYGQGAYGAGSAARIYFATDPAHLTLPQATLLAALPQAPSIYGADPTSAVVVRRQHTVLQDMVTSGYISPQQAQIAERTPLTFAFPNP